MLTSNFSNSSLWGFHRILHKFKMAYIIKRGSEIIALILNIFISLIYLLLNSVRPNNYLSTIYFSIEWLEGLIQIFYYYKDY